MSIKTDLEKLQRKGVKYKPAHQDFNYPGELLKKVVQELDSDCLSKDVREFWAREGVSWDRLKYNDPRKVMQDNFNLMAASINGASENQDGRN